MEISQPKLQTKKQLESIIKARIRSLMRKDGWFVVNHWQGMGSHRGFSDLTAIKNGVTVYIETKTPRKGSKQSIYQIKFQADIESHGGTYIVAKSEEDVYRLLSRRPDLVHQEELPF